MSNSCSRLEAHKVTWSSLLAQDDAPAQERLQYLHSIVYPPQWELKVDLAER
jgi:hypothetical protein